MGIHQHFHGGIRLWAVSSALRNESFSASEVCPGSESQSSERWPCLQLYSGRLLRIRRQAYLCRPTGVTTTLSSPDRRLRNSSCARSRTLDIGNNSFAGRGRCRRRSLTVPLST